MQTTAQCISISTLYCDSVMLCISPTPALPIKALISCHFWLARENQTKPNRTSTTTTLT